MAAIATCLEDSETQNTEVCPAAHIGDSVASAATQEAQSPQQGELGDCDADSDDDGPPELEPIDYWPSDPTPKTSSAYPQK
ncbi:unnamed protein product [Peniophora sp. CBMAI 1063]|nr:unnamed protein product [Peniophora sp. CBMAI 1063]